MSSDRLPIPGEPVWGFPLEIRLAWADSYDVLGEAGRPSDVVHLLRAAADRLELEILEAVVRNAASSPPGPDSR